MSRRAVLISFSLLLPFSILAAVSWGAVAIPLADVLSALFGEANQRHALIVQQIRLPRAVLAAIIGALLAISGAAMQGLFRNPLANQVPFRAVS